MVSLPSWCILKSQANDELVRKRYLFGEGLGKYLDKITNRKSKHSKKGIAWMLHLTYKTVVVECSTGTEDLADGGFPTCRVLGVITVGLKNWNG